MISIIIANFNNTKELDKTLFNISNQKISTKIEVIIVDNLSKDKIILCVNKYKGLISKFIYEKDNGIYEAWNKGLKYSKGKFIIFLGSGDKFTASGLRILLYQISKNPLLDWVTSRAFLYSRQGKIKIIGTKYFYKSFKKNMQVVHCGSIMKKTFIKKNNNYDTKFKTASDYDLILRSKNKIKTYFVNSVCILMLEGGISQSYLSLWEKFHVLNKNFPKKYLGNLLRLFKDIFFYFIKNLILRSRKLLKIILEPILVKCASSLYIGISLLI